MQHVQAIAVHPVIPILDCFRACVVYVQHEDAHLRLDAAKRLSAVAHAIGPKRAREELVPFLVECADNAEDEMGMTIAEELGKMQPSVGGASHAACLLQPLEALANMEETVVREAAVRSLCKLTSELQQTDIASSLLPLVSVRSHCFAMCRCASF